MGRRRSNRANRPGNQSSLRVSERLESRRLLSSGGGFSGSGILGSYYAGINLDNSGTVQPSFTRTDDRINFNFGGGGTPLIPPGGSTGPTFSALGTTNWSARWTGQVIPQYSEAYTFSTTSAAGVRLYIEAQGSSTYTMIINDWTSHAATVDTATYTMTAGLNYGIKLEYYQQTGAAQISLGWMSRDTPQSVIEPAVQVGINAATAVDYDPGEMFADAYKMARLTSWVGTSGSVIDSNGWPTGDGSFYLYAGQQANVNGKWTMTFTGKATVGLSLDPISGLTDTYNAATNNSVVTYTNTETSSGTLQVNFTNTRRLSSDTAATGITNITFMRPTSPGSTTSCAAGTLFTPAYETLMSSYTAIRFMDALGTNSNSSVKGGNSTQNWSDMLSPTYADQAGLYGGYQGQGIAIQYVIEMANETGKDAWINIPLQATDAFVTELADGLKYGFNAAGGAYTVPAANPAFAPLNSNLRAYLELSNEVWNGGFTQATLAAAIASNDVSSGNTDGQIINFDSINSASVWTQRWQILRSVEISNDFRSVWSASAMMNTIRPVFMYQYNNQNNTASNPLAFIDDYFNNANGVHVASPEPVGYYLYAAGGGWYNSVNNDTGVGEVTIPNYNFSMPALTAPSSQADPSGASWAFVGTSGVVSNNTNRSAAVASTTLGTLTTPITQIYGEGYEFTVGSSNLYLYQIGRYIASGNTATHNIFLFNSSFTQLASSVINTAGQTAGTYDYVSVGPILLTAGQSYYVITQEAAAANNDKYYGQDTTVTSIPGITVKNAESVNMGSPSWNQAQWTWITGTTGDHDAGPVSIKVATASVGTLGYPPDAVIGSQAAYIQGTAWFSQSLTFPAGVSDFTFYAAQGESGSENFTVSVDGVVLPAGYYTPYTPSQNYYVFYRGQNGMNLSAGAHTLTFTGAGNGTVFIDDVSVESADTSLNSGVQNLAPTIASEVDWDLAYGLQTVGYEGGFEVGGDANDTPANAAANVDPRAEQDTITSIDQYLSQGGNLPMIFTSVGEDWSVAMSAPYGIPNIYDQFTPKQAAYQSVMSALPPSVSNATTVPGTLTSSSLTLLMSDSDGKTYADTSGDIDLDAGWLSWNVLMPTAGTYTFTATTTGAGGTYAILADETAVASGASNGAVSGAIPLTAGLHAIKIQSTASGAFKVTSIVVTENGAPAAPVVTSASLSGSVGTLVWTPVTGATGYVIGYGNASGKYTSFTTVGNTSTGMVTGLIPTGVDYMAVYAFNTAGAYSLPSTEVRLAPRSTNPTQLITFEDQIANTVPGSRVPEPFVEGGLAFTSTGGAVGLYIEDGTSPTIAPGDWPSRVLEAASFGTNIIITGSTGQAFDLYSIDVGEDSGSLSAVLTETDSSGGTSSELATFPDTTDQHTDHVVLDWVDIVKVQVTFWNTSSGVGSQHNGSVDNLLTDDAPPTIANPASSNLAAVAGTSVNLSVLGADQATESKLTYTWAATTMPAGASAPLFSSNGTNAAKNTTAFFSRAGNYVFTVTVADAQNAVTTSTVSVTALQTLTGLTINPASSTVIDGATEVLTAAVTDQFGVAMGTQPGSYVWLMGTTGTGSINATGSYTAPSSGTGWATINASEGGYTATAAVYFAPAAAQVPNYYAGFSSNSTGLAFNGGANINNSTGAIQLTDLTTTTEIRSVYYTTKLATSAFVTDFGFQITNPVEDGFTFIIQNNSSGVSTLGSFGGGQLGYENITQSVALKFQLLDTNDVNNVGLFTNGTTPTTIGNPLGASGVSLESGDVFHAHIAYNGSNLSLTLTDVTRTNYPSVTEVYPIILSTYVGSNAYFGFTASSGGVSWGIPMTQNILWWTYGQPIVSITPVLPNLTSAPVSSVTINSTRPLSGVDPSDFSLSENGQTISLGNTPVIGTGNGGLAYTISNLAGLTGNLGIDTLAINGTGVTDVSGNSPAASAATSWTSNSLTMAANQTVSIAGAAGSIAVVTVNGGTAYNVSLSSLSPIFINGAAGNDTLTLDFSNGSPIPGEGLTYTGGAGDSLVVTGTADNDTATLGGSQLVFDGSVVNLPNVPTITLNTVGGDDTLTQTSQPAATTVTFNGGTGHDQLMINAGSYSLTADPQPLTSSLSVSANGIGTQVFFNPLSGQLIHLTGLTLTGGATATLVSLGNLRTANNRRALVLGTAGQTATPVFNIDGSSVLDLQDNDLVLHGGDYTGTNTLLKSGFNNGFGYWNGKGIASTVAAAGSLTALGEVQPVASGSVDGESYSTTDVLVRYTYYGDATLDGKIDGSDYSRIDYGFLNHLTGWSSGDFNYDGYVNGSDYTLIDNAFNTQAGPLGVIAAEAATTASIGRPSSRLSQSKLRAVYIPGYYDEDSQAGDLRHKRNAFSHKPINLPDFLTHV